jgi:hypothetical protein
VLDNYAALNIGFSDLIISGYNNAMSDDTKYARLTNEHNERHRAAASSLVADLERGLKHHSIHCISFTPCCQ